MKMEIDATFGKKKIYVDHLGLHLIVKTRLVKKRTK